MNVSDLVNQALHSGHSINEVLVINKTNELIKTANTQFNITLPNIDIRFDLKGRNAGQAIRHADQYTIRFNKDLVHNNSLKTIITDVVAHELAHIVLFYTHWGFGHDNMWKRICRILGGNGERCHSEQVESCRKSKQYEYTLSNGQTIVLGKTRHNRIQEGKIYITRDTGMPISSACQFREV